MKIPAAVSRKKQKSSNVRWEKGFLGGKRGYASGREERTNFFEGDCAQAHGKEKEGKRKFKTEKNFSGRQRGKAIHIIDEDCGSGERPPLNITDLGVQYPQENTAAVGERGGSSGKKNHV